MTGNFDFSFFLIPLISAIALVTDLVRGRIFNWLTVPAFIGGLVFSFVSAGWQGLLLGVAGALLGLALFGILFALRVMGGGDVKLMMALGAFGGPKYALETAIVSILLGGIMAAFLLLVKGRMPGFLKRMYIFVFSLFVRGLDYGPPQVDRELTMPFGIPIAIAAVWVLFAHPLQKMGVIPWL